MKKLIVVSVIVTLMMLVEGSVLSSRAQSPATGDTPTFYHLVPGTYVNGWPRFTVMYPKDWIEMLPRPEEAFRAAPPGPVHYPALDILVGAYPDPIEKFGDSILTVFRAMGATDVTFVTNKPVQLWDGTPAREFEIQYVINGIPSHFLVVAMKKEGALIHVDITSRTEIGEDLRAILYSLEFQPGFNEPVKLPPRRPGVPR